MCKNTFNVRSSLCLQQNVSVFQVLRVRPSLEMFLQRATPFDGGDGSLVNPVAAALRLFLLLLLLWWWWCGDVSSHDDSMSELTGAQRELAGEDQRELLD